MHSLITSSTPRCIQNSYFIFMSIFDEKYRKARDKSLPGQWDNWFSNSIKKIKEMKRKKKKKESWSVVLEREQ